jgi:hypothetical protein
MGNNVNEEKSSFDRMNIDEGNEKVTNNCKVLQGVFNEENSSNQIEGVQSSPVVLQFCTFGRNFWPVRTYIFNLQF